MKFCALVFPIVLLYLQEAMALLPPLKDFIAIRRIFVRRIDKKGQPVGDSAVTAIELQADSHLQYDSKTLGIRVNKPYMDSLIPTIKIKYLEAYCYDAAGKELKLGTLGALETYADFLRGDTPDESRFAAFTKKNQRNGLWCFACKLLGDHVPTWSEDVPVVTSLAEISADREYFDESYYLPSNKEQEHADFIVQRNPPIFYRLILKG